MTELANFWLSINSLISLIQEPSTKLNQFWHKNLSIAKMYFLAIMCCMDIWWPYHKSLTSCLLPITSPSLILLEAFIHIQIRLRGLQWRVNILQCHIQKQGSVGVVTADDSFRFRRVQFLSREDWYSQVYGRVIDTSFHLVRSLFPPGGKN